MARVTFTLSGPTGDELDAHTVEVSHCDDGDEITRALHSLLALGGWIVATGDTITITGSDDI